MAEKKHEIIRKAKEDLDKVLSDGILREIAEFEKTAIIEENSKISYAKEKGIETGSKNEKIETAKRLLKNGTDISLIKIATGFSKEEILKIREDLKI